MINSGAFVSDCFSVKLKQLSDIYNLKITVLFLDIVLFSIGSCGKFDLFLRKLEMLI